MSRRFKPSGFTLAEVLIIAPVVILVVASFIVFIVNITGEVLRLKSSVETLGQTQSALAFIKNDIKLSTGFVDTTNAITSPQGVNNDVTIWTNSGSTSSNLIVAHLATDKNPIRPESSFVYTNTPNSCGGGSENQNTPYIYYSVYFVSGGSLWQRNVMSGYPGILSALCTTPWQLPSCDASKLATDPTICKVQDAEIAKNVTSLSVQYLDSAGVATSDRSLADSVKVTVNTSKTVSGQTVTSSDDLRISKGGSEQNDSYDIGYSFASTAPTTPVFYWNAIPGATSYDVKYRVNGGAWSSVTNTAVTTFTYNGSTVYRNDTVGFQVTAKAGANALTSSTIANAAIPQWTPCQLQNEWRDYDYSWAGAEFTKTSAGVVMMRGLIADSSPDSGEVICRLPAGFVPNGGTIVFFTANGATTSGRLDIETDGDLIYYGGDGSWMSLSAATFMTGSTGWLTPPASNGWVDYGAQYAPVRHKVDTPGRVFVQGLAKNGSPYNNYVTVGYTLTGYGQSNNDIYPSYPCASVGSFYFNSSGQVIPRNLPTNVCWSVQALLYPSGYTGSGGWQTPTPPAGWSNYGSGYNSAGYIKSSDGIVSLRGLIVNASNGETLFTLPSGYRPSKTVICRVTTNPETFARVDVGSDGTVISREGTAAAWLSLAGCNFMADQ